MEQYIKKSALVAEIERRISLFKKEKKTEKWSAEASQMNVVSLGARIAMLEEILSFLDTLEVKEVNLEKEFCDYLEKNFMIGMTGILLSKNDEPINTIKLLDFAKHFFEFGMQVQYDRKLVKEIYSHLNDIKEEADRMTTGNFMHHRAAIKFSASTITKVLELIGIKE